LGSKIRQQNMRAVGRPSSIIRVHLRSSVVDLIRSLVAREVARMYFSKAATENNNSELITRMRFDHGFFPQISLMVADQITSDPRLSA